MKKIFASAIIALAVITQSCDLVMHDTIHGSGDITTETRSISDASKISSKGSFDVEVVLGSTPSVKIEADDNLIPYILVDNKDGGIEIHTKGDVNLETEKTLKVTVTVSKLEELKLYGNGNGTCKQQITGGDHLILGVYGNGDMDINVNTPKVESTIAGNGNISISGETKDCRIEIDGNGDYKAEGLQTENTEVHIAGSGDARLSASQTLGVHIAGSGDVFYKGSPRITQNVVGSGNIQQIK